MRLEKVGKKILKNTRKSELNICYTKTTNLKFKISEAQNLKIFVFEILSF